MSDSTSIRVGDVVRVRYGSQLVDAEVLEDRGLLGVSGDRVLRVGWTPTGSDERLEFEVPESQVSPSGASFESLVRTILTRFPLAISQPKLAGTWQPDFVIESKGNRVVVEAKSFPGGAAPKDVAEIERRLLHARDELSASDAVLVVPGWDRFLVRRDARPGVSIVPVAQLEEWLGDRLGLQDASLASNV